MGKGKGYRVQGVRLRALLAPPQTAACGVAFPTIHSPELRDGAEATATRLVRGQSKRRRTRA
jgi:hypothetical protein